jgi:hypothetical protein
MDEQIEGIKAILSCPREEYVHVVRHQYKAIDVDIVFYRHDGKTGHGRDILVFFIKQTPFLPAIRAEVIIALGQSTVFISQPLFLFHTVKMLQKEPLKKLFNAYFTWDAQIFRFDTPSRTKL